ncbi:MAG: MaoC family dehydratase [Pseudomonadota bacterium]
MSDSWPKPLQAATGPFRAEKLAGAAQGMGAHGEQLQALAAAGLVPPDVMTGLTLFLLGNQPRRSDKAQKIPGAGGGVAGGVWVRERFTIHRPLPADEAFHASGEAVGRHVHKGRRYGTNRCVTHGADGRLIANNLTTGLLAYKVEEGLADQLEGPAPDSIAVAGPDHTVAANNPCLGALRDLTAGQEMVGDAALVSLQLMEIRDTKNPDNPIHSDPELAKKAGLSRPIAGGAHVLAFPLQVVLQQLGEQALLHGTAFDIRWKAPVYADLTLLPSAKVRSVSADLVVIDLLAELENGPTAMVGELQVPLA